MRAGLAGGRWQGQGRQAGSVRRVQVRPLGNACTHLLLARPCAACLPRSHAHALTRHHAPACACCTRRYYVAPGKAKDFLDAWGQLEKATADEKGLRVFGLMRALSNNVAFVGYGEWESTKCATRSRPSQRGLPCARQCCCGGGGCCRRLHACTLACRACALRSPAATTGGCRAHRVMMHACLVHAMQGLHAAL